MRSLLTHFWKRSGLHETIQEAASLQGLLRDFQQPKSPSVPSPLENLLKEAESLVHPDTSSYVSWKNLAWPSPLQSCKGVASSSPLSSSSDSSAVLLEYLPRLVKQLRSHVQSSHPLLHTLNTYYMNQTGKQLRPLLVLLFSHSVMQMSASFSSISYDISASSPSPTLSSDKTPSMSLSPSSSFSSSSSLSSHSILPSQYRLAEITEMIHIASLLHDDILDEAHSRRHLLAAHLAFGNKAAVLSGDYLLAKASGLLAELNDTHVVQDMAQAICDLVHGEFMQLDVPPKHQFDLSYYLEKSFLKTGSLLAHALRSTARLAHQPDSVLQAAFQFGKKFGVAFQLIDDVLDYEVLDTEIGKTSFNDLSRGQFTAPLLFAAKQNKELSELLLRQDMSQPHHVHQAIQFVHASDGLQQTKELAERFVEEAINELNVLSIDSNARTLLKDLSLSILSRRK